jgi:hypothetical protein
VAVHGGSMTAARRHSGSEWAEEGKGLFTGGCSSYSRWRRERHDDETVGGTVAAVKPWARQSGGSRGWNVIGVVWAPTFGQ